MRQPPHYIVGIAGAAGAGKTTVANRIAERLKIIRAGVNVVRTKFAAPIREMLQVVGVEKGDGPGEIAHDLFRDAAQQLGQWFRDRDPDFWVNIVKQHVAGLSAPSLVLIDDTRHENEAAMCDLVVKLYTCRGTTLTDEQTMHPSETGWANLPCDLSYDNDDPQDVDDIAAGVTHRALAEMRQNKGA